MRNHQSPGKACGFSIVTGCRYNLRICVVDHCPSGEELVGVDDCVMCEIGYWKDNNINPFMTCQMCDSSFITETKGSTSEALCNIGESIFMQ